MSADQALKENVLRLADHHRQYCGEGDSCMISLSLLATLLDRAGIELTEEERRRLL